jgi:hypothetical protein
LPAAALPSGVWPRQADVQRPVPASAGDQASAKDEDLGRTVIGAVELAAQVQPGNLEICSRSYWQRQQFPRHQTLSGRPACGETGGGIHVVMIAAPTAVAATRPVMSVIGRDSHLRRHDAALDQGQAHAEQDRQEQCSDAMRRPATHRAPNMARSHGISKSLELTQFFKPSADDVVEAVRHFGSTAGSSQRKNRVLKFMRNSSAWAFSARHAALSLET